MRYIVVLACLLSGCGGGGSDPAAISPVARVVQYGYFGDTCDIHATRHASFQMMAGWCTNGTDIISNAIAAQAAGQKLVLIPPDQQESTLRFWLDGYRASNLLKDVIALYIDEPDALGMNDVQVKGLTDMWRRVAAEYIELAGIELWAVYGQHGTPGKQYFDKTGHDSYGSGPQLGEIILPGGAAPWREDPQSYVDAARSRLEVSVVMPFIWHWPGVGHEGDGIENSYIAPKYVAAGCQLTERC